MSGDYSLIASDLQNLFNMASKAPNDADYWRHFGAFVDYVAADPIAIEPAYHLLCTALFSKEGGTALLALEVINSLMNRPCKKFQFCIDKFRFLNNLLRLLSRQHMGLSTPPEVRRRIVEVMYSWTVVHPKLPRIRQAYDELKLKGVVEEDPTYLFAPLRSTPNSDFFDGLDLSPAESNKLKKMLNSRKRSDHAAANSIIRRIFSQQENEVRAQATQERLIDEFNAQSKLLSSLIGRLEGAHGNSSPTADLINLSYSEKESLDCLDFSDVKMESVQTEIALNMDELVLGERIYNGDLNDFLSLGMFAVRNEGVDGQLILGVITNMSLNDVDNISVITNNGCLEVVKETTNRLSAFNPLRASPPYSFVMLLRESQTNVVGDRECCVAFSIKGIRSEVPFDLFTPIYNYLNS